MKANSKRGAALAYVIVVSAALLILASALVSVAQYNLTSSQNSLEGRQAYLDAKSAIEYGKAYIDNNPDSDGFTVLYNSAGDSGFKIGAVGAANSVAVYDSTKKLLSATGKYKSSDRIRKLGYQFSIKAGGTSLPSINIAPGLRHGGTSVFNSNYLLNNITVDVPILACHTAKLSGSPGTFNASQMYYMGADDSNACFEVLAGHSSITLKADFFSFKGDIVSKSGDMVSVTLKSNQDGIVYFDHSRILINGVNQLKNIPELNGYYSFDPQKGLDIFNATAVNSLTPMSSKVDSLFVDNNNYILENYKNIISAESEDSDGAKWLSTGSLNANTPLRKENNIVFVYVTSSSNWGNLFDNNSNPITYCAKVIYWQYVNNRGDFIIPTSQNRDHQLVFKADTISISTQADDLNQSSTRPHIKQDKIQNTHGVTFNLQSLSGSGNITVNIINTITVDCADNTNFKIDAGTYTVKSGSSFFNPDTWKDKTSAGSGSGGSGGGTTTTEGGYTNG
jgi:hypothetical protein